MDIYSFFALLALLLSFLNLVILTKKDWVSQALLGVAFIFMGLHSITTNDLTRVTVDFAAAIAGFFWAWMSYRKNN